MLRDEGISREGLFKVSIMMENYSYPFQVWFLSRVTTFKCEERKCLTFNIPLAAQCSLAVPQVSLMLLTTHPISFIYYSMEYAQ